MFRNDRDLKPRKKSYYAFSKNYPSRRTGTTYSIGESRARRQKERNSTIAYAVCLVVIFVLAFAVAWITLALSKRPIDSGANSAVSDPDGYLKAVSISSNELAGGIAFDLFQSTLSEQGANAVLLDFKNQEGYLCTQNEGDTASDIGAAANAVTAAGETVQRLKAAGYKIIARVYCFCDPLAAATLPGAAVTEADGVTVWLDESAQNDGDPWLNPYSEVARLYLLQVIEEAVDFGADVVLLDGVSFPDGRYIDRALFPGETESTFSRNAILHDFIEQAQAAAGEIPVAAAMSLSAALHGDLKLYDGGIFDSAASFCAVDLHRSVLSDGTMLGDTAYSAELPEEQFVSAAVKALQNKIDENYRTKELLPMVYAAEDVLYLENAGIHNYIWIVEKDA